MTKRDIVTQVASVSDLTQQQIQTVVEQTLETVSSALASGEHVELRGFGSFTLVQRKAKLARNLGGDMKPITIPPRFVIVFKPGQALAESLKELEVANE